MQILTYRFFEICIIIEVQVKSSQLYLGRVALSAIGWCRKGPCVNYDYTIKI